MQEIKELKIGRFEWLYSVVDLNKKIVDIGCGDAYLWKRFNVYGHENVTLVDIDSYPHPNFVRADAHNLPFEDKTFDIALLCEILEHVRDPVQVLKEAKRVTKEKILITVPDEDNWISLYRPKTPIWKELILQLRDPVEHARVSNPEAKDFHPDLTHLYHNRYYDERMLREHLELAGLENFEIFRLIKDCWAFFAVKVFV